MTNSILIIVSFFVIFLITFFVSKKNRKNNVLPTPPTKPKPEVTNTPTNEIIEPTPLPVNDLCYSHEVVVTENFEDICTSEFFVTVYTTNLTVCDEPCQMFMSEEACKHGRPNWNDKYKYVRCGAKYSKVDDIGNANEFMDCIF